MVLGAFTGQWVYATSSIATYHRLVKHCGKWRNYVLSAWKRLTGLVDLGSLQWIGVIITESSGGVSLTSMTDRTSSNLGPKSCLAGTTENADPAYELIFCYILGPASWWMKFSRGIFSSLEVFCSTFGQTELSAHYFRRLKTSPWIIKCPS